MDLNLAIEQNLEALRRILASLVAMAALAGSSPTLTRRLHRAVTKLLRPAESAARRLIIMAAHGIKVAPPPPPRPKKPEPKTNEPLLRSLGIAVVMSHADLIRAATAARRPAVIPVKRPPTLSLPLFDPLRLPRRWRPIQRSVPRILFPGNPDFVPAPARKLPTPDDQVSGRRLALRFQALAAVLGDLPRHALRLARLRASRKAARARDRETPPSGPIRWWLRRDQPLKPGNPPGWRRKSRHPVDEVLKDVHHFAFYALEKPDTS